MALIDWHGAQEWFMLPEASKRMAQIGQGGSRTAGIDKLKVAEKLSTHAAPAPDPAVGRLPEKIGASSGPSA